ncbi:tyrosine-type recombinase/integrase [Yoonia maritima]|uniref:tyrosine-type recombinase/integrase n=1 Tax=Yoonia maritima TaxID=1435347 RepID=UPI0037364A61
MTRINERFIRSLKAADKEQFHRDSTLKGFGVRVSPSGRISFIAEGRIRGGKTKRMTLGQHPALSVSMAQGLAREHIATMQRGEDPKAAKDAAKIRSEMLGKTLGDMFEDYLKARDLKPKTQKDYENTFHLIFNDWSSRPIRSISRKECESRYIETADNRGRATAVKAFRIVSAVFTFAKADDIGGERLITENPMDVISQKKYDRSIKPRQEFLSQDEIAKLVHYWHTELHWPETPYHGVTDQGINYVMLLMCSGLRKSEALKLRWENIDDHAKHMAIYETKNGTNHYVPLSKVITQILTRQKAYLATKNRADSPWVFPARRGEGHMTEPKSQLQKICAYTGVKFRLHDLRRTFATHAEINGSSYELIRKALNHKASTVTATYIVTQVDTLRPVFDAVADGYHNYFDPDRSDA